MLLPKILKTKITRENFTLVGVLLILAAIPLTVILLGIRQELRKRAAEEGSILINAGAETTNSPNVTLALAAPGGTAPPTQTFDGDPRDGIILGYGSYSEARSTSYNGYGDNDTIKVGQQDVGNTGRKKIDRSYVLFDTSAIPDNAIITDVKLCLRISGAYPSSNPFDVGIHKFNFSTPITSQREENYDGALAAPLDQVLTSVDVGGSIGPEVCNSVSLDPSWVSKTGYTKYALLASTDVAGQNPGKYEYQVVNFHSAETQYPPRLEVTYTTPSAFSPSRLFKIPQAQAAGCTLSCRDAGLGVASCDVSMSVSAVGCRIYWDGKQGSYGGCRSFMRRACALDGSSPSKTIAVSVKATDGPQGSGNVVATCSDSFYLNCDFTLPPAPVCGGLEGPDQAAPGSFNFFEISGDSGDYGLYGWKASCGSFPSGLVTKTNSWTAPETPGTCTITASVSDGHGGIGECTKDVQVVADGDERVEAMMISNFENFQGAVEESFATTKSWTLTEGDGLKTVWAKFKVGGVWTTPVSDSITLDTSAGPTPTPTPPPGSVTCNETCLSAGYQCISGLQCVQLSDLVGSDKCRNPNCPQEADCVCSATTPTPTPTPPPGGYLKLDLLKVWFWKQDKALGQGHEGAVVLVLKQGGNVVFEKEFKLDENGEARNADLPGVTAGTYDAFVYEPGYLTKKLSGVSIGQSGNNLDFTKNETEYFLVGDFNGDQEVNILDFSIFVKSYGKQGEE